MAVRIAIRHLKRTRLSPRTSPPRLWPQSKPLTNR
jgi:hypothetical protein